MNRFVVDEIIAQTVEWPPYVIIKLFNKEIIRDAALRSSISCLEFLMLRKRIDIVYLAKNKPLSLLVGRALMERWIFTRRAVWIKHGFQIV